MSDLKATVGSGFRDKNIIIVGDIVADQFLQGTIARISREAPVLILKHDKTETSAGAAANTAVNVATLGGRPTLIGLVGADADGEALKKVLKTFDVSTEMLVIGKEIKTTTKTRVLAGQHYAARQQVLRIDYENAVEISVDLHHQLRQNLLSAADSADVIIISDYDYGVASEELFKAALNISKEKDIPLLIDSRHGLTKFIGASSATPNEEEVEEILGNAFNDEDCNELRRKLGFESMLVTRGNKGMLLLERNCTPLRIPVVGSPEPVDVVGAGDTVIAAYALGLAAGFGYAQSATIANHAGGIAVMKKGTAAVSLSELISSLRIHGSTIAETAS